VPGPHSFEHLPLLRRYRGPARLFGGGKTSPQTRANRQARALHAQTLQAAAQARLAGWGATQAQRLDEGLPVLPQGVPVLLQVDPDLDLDVLREKFDFEIVAEQEEGYVIVASHEIDLNSFLAMVQGFSVEVHGSAKIASIHRLFDDPNQVDRLRRILSDSLYEQWPNITDQGEYIVDLGIACAGTAEIPTRPTRGKKDTDATWATKEAAWSAARAAAYAAWDDIKIVREDETLSFLAAYHAEIIHLVDSEQVDATLPDSFTVRVRVSGKGLKDFVLNFPFVFEVVEPEDIVLPQHVRPAVEAGTLAVAPTPPPQGAPTVCVIDSGIQEGHILLAPAIDAANSQCFLPGVPATAIGDEVTPAGHGTRVAGAILYGESVPKAGAPQLSVWIQNARVLDQACRMPVEVFPPSVLRAVVQRFNDGEKPTRIFNHSINASGPCRMRHMSAWAAEIDLLSLEHDVLFVQSAGNILETGTVPLIGVKEHLIAGRQYPGYLAEPACRVANPAQSLQGLSVGSVAYGHFEDGPWFTFANVLGQPSAFTRGGPAIWDVIKPELVEYGGDCARTNNNPPDVGRIISDACPELVRSTMHPPGFPVDRDQIGTSFSTPKVARIAAEVCRVLPEASMLLVRALLVQSARWPAWAEAVLTQLRGSNLPAAQRTALSNDATRAIRYLGFGIPDMERATSNTDFCTTFITAEDSRIQARECHIYLIPIPPELRAPGGEFDVRIDVTLSYAAQPRRTRRNLRRYLSTWVDWKSSNLGENMDDFRERALRESDDAYSATGAASLPWALQNNPKHGLIRGVRRSAGTVQKDWAIVKSNALPSYFCIAVVGHQGWSRDPDSSARYALAVTIDVLGHELPIYEPLRAAVEELEAEIAQEVEVEVAVQA
jgi:hypothetical protein